MKHMTIIASADCPFLPVTLNRRLFQRASGKAGAIEVAFIAA